MRFVKTVAAGVAALGLFAVSVVPAWAAPPASFPGSQFNLGGFGGMSNQVRLLGPVILDHGDPATARVLALYACAPGEDAPHLWVSVKQNEDATVDQSLTQEGSGFEQVASAWLQSHPSDEVTCDARIHVGWFEVNTDEPLPPEAGGTGTVGYGELQRGQAYVQFCLFDGHGVLISQQEFRTVV